MTTVESSVVRPKGKGLRLDYGKKLEEEAEGQTTGRTKPVTQVEERVAAVGGPRLGRSGRAQVRSRGQMQAGPQGRDTVKAGGTQ